VVVTIDALARIDAALEGRCACGCGAVLDPSGPSAWFASEACQRRWQAAGRALPGVIPVLDPDVVNAMLRQAIEALTQGFAQFGSLFAAIGRALVETTEQIRPLLPERPPEDPMQRALWLRRNRNTGPKQIQRAPRSIGPKVSR
jgi:hypothetical protein